MGTATGGDTVRLAPVKIQPAHSDDVAAAGIPVNGVAEIAGPDAFRLGELVRQGLAAGNGPRTVAADPHATYFGAELEGTTLLPGPDARINKTRLADWSAQRQ
ncbi:hypothetical protein ACFQ0G_08595 [Streptomyces chiangmaiensis]